MTDKTTMAMEEDQQEVSSTTATTEPSDTDEVSLLVRKASSESIMNNECYLISETIWLGEGPFCQLIHSLCYARFCHYTYDVFHALLGYTVHTFNLFVYAMKALFGSVHSNVA